MKNQTRCRDRRDCYWFDLVPFSAKEIRREQATQICHLPMACEVVFYAQRPYLHVLGPLSYIAAFPVVFLLKRLRVCDGFNRDLAVF